KLRTCVYYILRSVRIRAPPLRERREDVHAMAQYFLDEFCARNNFRRKTIDEDVFAMLESYGWPGNARELKNTIERMAILSAADRISAAAVPLEMRLTPAESDS